jgi:hypothetical protein
MSYLEEVMPFFNNYFHISRRVGRSTCYSSHLLCQNKNFDIVSMSYLEEVMPFFNNYFHISRRVGRSTCYSSHLLCQNKNFDIVSMSYLEEVMPFFNNYFHISRRVGRSRLCQMFRWIFWQFVSFRRLLNSQRKGKAGKYEKLRRFDWL